MLNLDLSHILSLDLSILLSLGLILFCIIRLLQSRHAASQGIVDNGAQTVVSLGVLLTFIGITYSLMNFDTNPDTIAQEIDRFVDGMKAAFYTSVIGMFFGLLIKAFQSRVEQKGEQDALEGLSEIKSVRNSMDEYRADSREQTQEIVAAIRALKASVDASSTEQLSMALAAVSGNMGTFISSIEASQDNMRQFSENAQQQAQEFSRLLSGSIETLCQKIEESGAEQTRQLATMNETVGAMAQNSAQAAKSSESLLADTRSYQQESLANDKSLADILTRNTQTIDGMRESFDKFLQDMAENYSNELINALNKSMEKLNTQLQTQFGENFRHLNEAVEAVVVWQRQYMEHVERSTKMLEATYTTFREFQQAVAGEVDAHIATLSANLNEFTAMTEQNVGIQHSLSEATRELAGMVGTARENVAAMQDIARRFTELSTQTTESINEAFAAQGKAIAKNMAEASEEMRKLSAAQQEQVRGDLATLGSLVEGFTGQMRQLDDTAMSLVTDTSHYLRDFRSASDDVTKSIREALEAFRSDFDRMTKAELKGLQAVFQQMATNTDKQQDKAIKSLAGAMGAISEQVIGNYNALISRIAELDALLKSGGGKR